MNSCGRDLNILLNIFCKLNMEMISKYFGNFCDIHRHLKCSTFMVLSYYGPIYDTNYLF